VFYKVIENSGAALAAGLAALIVLIGLWLGYPAWYRQQTAWSAVASER